MGWAVWKKRCKHLFSRWLKNTLCLNSQTGFNEVFTKWLHLQPIKRWTQNWNGSVTKWICKRQKRSCFKIVNTSLKGFQILFEKNTVFCIDFIKRIKVRLPIQHKRETTLLKRCFLGIWLVCFFLYLLHGCSFSIYIWNVRMINLYTVIRLLNKYLLKYCMNFVKI